MENNELKNTTEEKEGKVVSFFNANRVLIGILSLLVIFCLALLIVFILKEENNQVSNNSASSIEENNNLVPAVSTTSTVVQNNKDKESDAIILEDKKTENLRLLDTDFDGLSDYEEIEIYETNPEKMDTDDDGYSDLEEIDKFFNPKGKGEVEKFSKPYSALFYLEQQFSEQNYKLYNEKTYFSDTLEEDMKNDLNISIDDYKQKFIANYENNFTKRLKVERIRYDKKEIIDDKNIHLEYSLIFDDKTIKEDDTYLIRIDDEWYINLEPEYNDMKSGSDYISKEQWKIYTRQYKNFDFNSNTSNNKELTDANIIKIIEMHEVQIELFKTSVSGKTVMESDLFTADSQNLMKANEGLMQVFYSFSLYQVESGFYTDIIKYVDENINRIYLDEEELQEIRSLVSLTFDDSGNCKINVPEENSSRYDKILGNYGYFTKCESDKAVWERSLEHYSYPYAKTSDNRIRFYRSREFIPYDLVLEDEKWKIDLEISEQHFNKIHNGVEKIEHLEGEDRQSYFRILDLVGLIKALENYKEQNSFYPITLMDLFPDYYIYRKNIDKKDKFSTDTHFFYSYAPKEKPQKIHLGLYLKDNFSKEIKELDKNFNSEKTYENGFDGEKASYFDVLDNDFVEVVSFMDELLKKVVIE